MTQPTAVSKPRPAPAAGRGLAGHAWARRLTGSAALWLATLVPTGAASREGFVPPASPAEWEAAANTFPHLVRRAPRSEAGSAPRPAVPASRIEVRPGLDFLRVRDLDADLPVVAGALESPRLIIDLRYLRGDRDESIRLGQLLTRRGFSIFERSGEDTAPTELQVVPAGSRGPAQVTLVLVNAQTSGPLEAVLAALQDAGEIVLVGGNTAGEASVFSDAPGAPGWQTRTATWLASRAGGEPAPVEPRLSIAVDESDDAAAFGALESGEEITQLLDPPVEKPRFDEARLLRQFDESTQRTTPHATTTSPSPPPTSRPRGSGIRPPFDRILHRAVNTIVALEALGRLPPVPGNGG